MFDAAKHALARREALKEIRKRTPRTWDPDPQKRRVLVVLPTEQEDAKVAWRFVQSLGAPHRLVTPVVPDSVVTYVPVEYIGRVHRLEAKHLGMTGLPKREFSSKVWSDPPDIAFCLHPEPDIASLYLVGASAATLRVGLHSDKEEAFFDLMARGEGGLEGALAVLRDTLVRIRPPVLPFDD